MFTRYVLPLLAVIGLGYGLMTVLNRPQQTMAQPLVEPPTHPKMKSIAGAGIIESKMENIPIGTVVPGVVNVVKVKVGDRVKKGDEFFCIDDRDLQAELKVRGAMVLAAKAQLHKLESAPRPEDIPPATAAVEESKARLFDAEVAMGRSEKLYSKQMVPASEHDKDRYTYLAAKAAVEKAQAELQKILAGSWKEDIEIARAAVVQAESSVESIRANLDRLIVRAPTDGQVLQVNVRPGQLASQAWKEPMVVLGNVDQLHVRVDIDENDAPYFDRTSPAVATLKGRPQVRFPLTPVKVEPYVIPKRSLTGDNAERVDTRVLQVVYALPGDRSTSLYVGQQMDVYIKATEPKDVSLETKPGMKLPFEEE